MLFADKFTENLQADANNMLHATHLILDSCHFYGHEREENRNDKSELSSEAPKANIFLSIFFFEVFLWAGTRNKLTKVSTWAKPYHWTVCVSFRNIVCTKRETVAFTLFVVSVFSWSNKSLSTNLLQPLSLFSLRNTFIPTSGWLLTGRTHSQKHRMRYYSDVGKGLVKESGDRKPYVREVAT